VTEDGQPLDDRLRQLEARVDARFQGVNARFISADSRFAELGDRANEIDQQLQALARRCEARIRSADNRLDATRTQVDHVRTQALSEIDHTRREVGRILLLGLLGTTLATAMLCLGTIILVI
jgi:chromosome segregation ATPase